MRRVKILSNLNVRRFCIGLSLERTTTTNNNNDDENNNNRSNDGGDDDDDDDNGLTSLLSR